MKVLTAIPVYNEERHVEPVLNEVRRYSPHILVVNDGSGDGTADILDYSPGVTGDSRGLMLPVDLKERVIGTHTYTGDFTVAGGHFDPGPAGNTDPDANHPFHMGDIPNLEVGANGEGKLTGVTTRVTLSPGPLSLFDADGSAIIIHGNDRLARSRVVFIPRLVGRSE